MDKIQLEECFVNKKLFLKALCCSFLVDGSWSRWSLWSRCDRACGGGRSIRTRSCSSPPPKNGGRKCVGEKNQVKPCNTKSCGTKKILNSKFCALERAHLDLFSVISLCMQYAFKAAVVSLRPRTNQVKCQSTNPFRPVTVHSQYVVYIADFISCVFCRLNMFNWFWC